MYWDPPPLIICFCHIFLCKYFLYISLRNIYKYSCLFFRPLPYPPLPTSVKTQNQPPETFKCLNCNEEFSDLQYLEVHREIHNPDSKVDNKNEQIQNNEQLNSGDVNTSGYDDNSEHAIGHDVNKQNNDFHGREIEIKLEITNIVTLKDELDCKLDNYKNNDNEQIEEEANEDFNIHKQLESFEPDKPQEIVQNSEQDSIGKNNEYRTNASDLIGQNCLKSFNIDDEAEARVVQDENIVDSFENNENSKVEFCKTNEDDLMVNNKDKDKENMAKAILLETDA